MIISIIFEVSVGGDVFVGGEGIDHERKRVEVRG